ncbi:MAG: glycosyltransferase [Chloroflexota bacterium]
MGARAGGIPGVIDDGRNGFLVEYGDVTGLANAIGRLLDDPELAEKLGADGLQKVTTDLTWEQTAARAEAAYRQILDRA